jgi:hypothetical protein
MKKMVIQIMNCLLMDVNEPDMNKMKNDFLIGMNEIMIVNSEVMRDLISFCLWSVSLEVNCA